jgi:Outer membrane protein
MRKLLLLSILLLSFGVSFGQKYAVVDSDYILKKIPNYRAALEQLDKLSQQYQRDIQQRFEEVDQAYRAYQAEKVLLTEEMKKSREADLQKKELEANELQRKYFGPEGLLFKKREELLKPFYDQISAVVKDMANEGNYALILDKANNPSVLFVSPRYDKSDEVLQKLGYK